MQMFRWRTTLHLLFLNNVTLTGIMKLPLEIVPTRVLSARIYAFRKCFAARHFEQYVHLTLPVMTFQLLGNCLYNLLKRYCSILNHCPRGHQRFA